MRWGDVDREWSKEIMETKSGKKEIKKRKRSIILFFFLCVQKRRSYQDRQDHKCGFYLNGKKGRIKEEEGKHWAHRSAIHSAFNQVA